MRFCALPCAALLEVVTLGVHLEDVDVVGEAVEERAGEAFSSEPRARKWDSALLLQAEGAELRFASAVGTGQGRKVRCWLNSDLTATSERGRHPRRTSGSDT